MKHLLSGVAIAAFMATGLPAFAQSGHLDNPKQPAANSPQNDTSTSSDRSSMSSSEKSSMSSGMPMNHDKMHKNSMHQARDQKAAHRRGGQSPEDNMAEELNRQELQQVTQRDGKTPNGGQSGTSNRPQ